MKKSVIMAAAAAALCACSPASPPKTDESASAPSGDYAAQGVIAQSLPEISAALAKGETSSAALVKAYLARIDAVDRSGPALQAVLTLNPEAIRQAEASDARRKAGAALGPLDGVPVLLKDNIESKDPMPTTAGALALEENVTGRDSPLVAGLRAQGAVILGKTNLSQWANFRSNWSMSGWSALGGQVRNPHMLDRNPCGSSSGSGAAAAASLAAGTVGTETNGSITCPSTVNGVVGFKPTVGLVSQKYIVPISFTQDTAGPMTKTVMGAAMMLNAMATGPAKTDYVAALRPDALKGARIGVARFAQGSNDKIRARFDKALKALQDAGAVLVEIKAFKPDAGLGDAEGKILQTEFKASVNDYLAHAPDAVKTRDLASLIAFNKQHADVELVLFGQDVFEDSQKEGGLDDPAYKKAMETALKAAREDGVDKLMKENGVDALVAPTGPIAPPVDPVNGDVWPDFPGIGSLAAIAGYPHLTVPMGAVDQLPVGLSFVGTKDEDAKILSYGYAFEQATHWRPEPRYLKNAEAIPAIAAAMKAKGGAAKARP
ncbi:MAG: amidase [Alphaproteobacteria bacterium]|nr:amidase [Alphaproteobacteria bacterium]